MANSRGLHKKPQILLVRLCLYPSAPFFLHRWLGQGPTQLVRSFLPSPAYFRGYVPIHCCKRSRQINFAVEYQETTEWPIQDPKHSLGCVCSPPRFKRFLGYDCLLSGDGADTRRRGELIFTRVICISSNTSILSGKSFTSPNRDIVYRMSITSRLLDRKVLSHPRATMLWGRIIHLSGGYERWWAEMADTRTSIVLP